MPALCAWEDCINRSTLNCHHTQCLTFRLTDSLFETLSIVNMSIITAPYLQYIYFTLSKSCALSHGDIKNRKITYTWVISYTVKASSYLSSNIPGLTRGHVFLHKNFSRGLTIRLLSQMSLNTCKKLKTDGVLVIDLHLPGLWTVDCYMYLKKKKFFLLFTAVIFSYNTRREFKMIQYIRKTSLRF